MPPKKKPAAPTAASTSTATSAPEAAAAPTKVLATEAVAVAVSAAAPAEAAPQAATAVAAFFAAASDATATSSELQQQRFTARQDDYITVVVTPKLTFQLCRRPEWQTVQDISQEELRRGFLSRFPPAMWMSSEKFSFKPALAPTAAITEDTHQLVYKLVSDDVPDERVMLSILRELEKSYEGIIRRAVTETRSEALQEHFAQQEQAEETRRELEKQSKELRRDNKSLRDQLQSIQKRLFLVEQEKDQLRKEQSQTQERVTKAEREHTRLANEARMEQEAVREELATLRVMLEGVLATGAPTLAAVEAEIPSAAACPNKVAASREVTAAAQPAEGKAQEAGVSPAAPALAAAETTALETVDMRAARSEANASTQTESPCAEASAQCVVSFKPPASGGDGMNAAVADVSRRIDGLQQQMGALRGWLLQGSHLFAAASPVLMAVPPTVGGSPY